MSIKSEVDKLINEDEPKKTKLKLGSSMKVVPMDDPSMRYHSNPDNEGPDIGDVLGRSYHEEVGDLIREAEDEFMTSHFGSSLKSSRQAIALIEEFIQSIKETRLHSDYEL